MVDCANFIVPLKDQFRAWGHFLTTFEILFTFVFAIVIVYCNYIALLIGVHKNLLIHVCAFQIELEFGCVGFYCAFHKHANSEVQNPPLQLRFSLPSVILTDLLGNKTLL